MSGFEKRHIIWANTTYVLKIKYKETQIPASVPIHISVCTTALASVLASTFIIFLHTSFPINAPTFAPAPVTGPARAFTFVSALVSTLFPTTTCVVTSLLLSTVFFSASLPAPASLSVSALPHYLSLFYSVPELIPASVGYPTPVPAKHLVYSLPLPL